MMSGKKHRHDWDKEEKDEFQEVMKEHRPVEIVAEGYGAEWGVLVVRGDDGKHYVIYHNPDGARLVAVLDNWFNY